MHCCFGLHVVDLNVHPFHLIGRCKLIMQELVIMQIYDDVQTVWHRRSSRCHDNSARCTADCVYVRVRSRMHMYVCMYVCVRLCV